VLCLMKICREQKSLDELHAEPVYQWLRQRLPRAFQAPARDEFGFVLGLASCMALAIGIEELSLLTPDRQSHRDKQRATVKVSKQRAKARRDLQRVESYLKDGILNFPPTISSEKRELFANILKALRGELERPRSRRPKQPILMLLAGCMRVITGNAVDAQLLADVAALCDLRLDERTAQRYASKIHQMILTEARDDTQFPDLVKELSGLGEGLDS